MAESSTGCRIAGSAIGRKGNCPFCMSYVYVVKIFLVLIIDNKLRKQAPNLDWQLSQ